MPRPHLRAYIINHADATLLRLAREANIEAGIVDEQNRIGPPFLERAHHFPKHSPKKGEAPRHLHEANDGHFARGVQKFHSLRRAFIAGNAEGRNLVTPLARELLRRTNGARGDAVARGFASDEENVTAFHFADRPTRDLPPADSNH